MQLENLLKGKIFPNTDFATGSLFHVDQQKAAWFKRLVCASHIPTLVYICNGLFLAPKIAPM